MEYVVHGYHPASVFRFFEEISAIPRGSYNESGIADYLERFAADRGLFSYRDEHHNVLIKAPATAGLESVPPVLFQGHTDMVCEKNADVEHDFLRDPLKLYVENGFLRARGTTLGADNGIAVAMMLALLDGEVAEHPAIECLFTTAEEVGLNGAIGFDYSRISARRMINMDSETLGLITAGCAGGIRSDLSCRLHPEPFCGGALRVSIRGLMGGHSGENIKSGRANANKLMGRLLSLAIGEIDFRIVRLAGGSKDNAIPRECEAILACADTGALCDLLTDAAAEIARELSSADRGFTFLCEDCDDEAVMSSHDDTAHLIALLSCAANGVLEMSRDVAGLVEYSRNLGVIRTEDETVHVVFSSRSSIESRLDASVAELDALASVTGCTAKHHSRYPGWEYAPTSALRDAYAAAYRTVTGKDVIVNVIHAGLECGIIYSKLPDMDIISIGPSMRDIHSPDEALDLAATEEFWKTVVQLINDLK